jgi:hypothetical protein
VAAAFYILLNEKSTKILPCEHFGFRDDHIKGTSHRKEESDLV